MDDLDHSMHISDYDWLSFFEESEECCLLQPSLAYPDSSGLSDADDLEFPTETCADCTKSYTPIEDSEEPKVLEKEVSIVRCVEDQLSQQPAESDLKSTQEPKLPVTTTGAFGGDCASCPGTRAEKERWFVTVNDNPHRHQVPGSGPSVKKRRKQKKILKEDDTHKARGDTRSDLDITSQIKTDPGSIQEKYLEITSTDLTNTCLGASSKEDHLQCLAIENTSDPTSDIGKPNDDLLAPNTNSVESDEFADDEFFSSCSNDSENYLSAAESVEEPQHISLPNSPLNLPESINAADNLADRAMHISDNPLTCSGTTISCHQSNGSQTHVETSQIFPSAHHSTDTTPNDNSTCDNGTKSTELCMSVDKPTSAVNLSSAIGDQPESLPTPDVTVDSPEAYVRATGNTQSVYAISAFWDEMEKFTINDILQIRMGRCMLPVEKASDELQGCTSDTASPVNPESGILDVSDTTDSDYCTHLDESKPDRSSCDFSTSDFEEEYWQFINSSRSSSTDHYDKSYRFTDSASTGAEESDEMGTPVPSEDYSSQQWSGDSTFSLCDLASPQQIRKNKSMYDISALNSLEDLSSRSFLDRSSSESLVEPLKMSDGFEVVTPVMCHTDEHYQISFPKVFEYLFADNKAKYEAMSVSVYGLQEMPTSPVHDYTLCTADSDLPMSCSEEPIPIFSCSYPTVRELTFPKPGCFFLGTNYTSMKDVSPIQIVSQSLLRSIDCKHTDRSYCFSQDLSSLFSIKKVCFQDRGSVDASDVWRYQIEDEKKAVNTTDSCIMVVSEEGVLPVTLKTSRDAALRQIAMEGNQIPTGKSK